MGILEQSASPTYTRNQDLEVMDNPEADMDWTTQWDLARSADDEQRQREIVAKQLGISIDDVFKTPKGLAYRQGGKAQLVNPSDFNSQAWQLGADVAAKPGGMIGGAIGAVGGPVGTVVGSAIGDLVQSGVEELTEGHDRSAGEYAQSALTEGALAGAGEAVFRGGRGLYRMAKSRFGKSVEQMSPDELAEAIKLMGNAKSKGIQLTPAESTNNRAAINAQNWLLDTPTKGARKLDDFMSGRQTDVSNAIEASLGSKSPHEAYNAYRGKLMEARAGLVSKRADASGSLYAKAANLKVKDMQPVIAHLAERIESAQGTSIGNALK